MVPVFKNVGKRSTAKNYHPVSLPSVVSKAFGKLMSNRIVDPLEIRGFFSDFQYGFRSSRSTADLLAVVSDRIAGAFNRSGATRAVALDISMAFDRVSHVGILHKLKSYGISSQIFGLISSFLRNRRFRVIRHLICGKLLNWLLNLNLIYETLWTGGKRGMLILMLGKLSWFHLTSLITMVLLM